jgi:hypothetical protein
MFSASLALVRFVFSSLLSRRRVQVRATGLGSNLTLPRGVCQDVQVTCTLEMLDSDQLHLQVHSFSTPSQILFRPFWLLV